MKAVWLSWEVMVNLLLSMESEEFFSSDALEGIVDIALDLELQPA